MPCLSNKLHVRTCYWPSLKTTPVSPNDQQTAFVERTDRYAGQRTAKIRRLDSALNA